MKKVGKGILNFLKGIYRIIDKFIVTPISRLIFNISEYLKNHNIRLDYIINRQHFMIYVSLILAIVMFFLIDHKVISFVESEAVLIPNVPVKVNYNDYVVEGIPETVDIILIGRKSDIYLAEQLGDNNVVLDLSDYKPRDSAYKVYLSYTKSIDSIDYKLDPSYVFVTIKEKITVKKTIDYDLVNNDSLSEKLSVKNVELHSTEVSVSGSEDAINNIASIKALIDLSNDTLKDAGTYDLDNIPVVAYDSKGEKITNVKIVPETISATVTLDTYSKTVPIKVLTTGNLVTGKAIASILINNNNSHSVTIYGNQEDINKIDSVPVTINVEGQGATTKTYPVTISKPTGVRAISDKNLNITVTFGDEKQKELIVTSVQPENLASGLTPNIRGTKNISVMVKGVQSVIDSVDATDIYAYINLEKYGKGVHNDVVVQIKNDDPKLKFVVTSTVTVELTD